MQRPSWGWPSAAALLLALAGVAGAADPYRDFRGAGVRFVGPGRDLEPPDTLTAIRIGLTAPERGEAGAQLRLGVELAVAEANAAGGYRGLPFRVAFRPDDLSWAVVAAQVVRLASEDGAWGIIASLDGERAHAAELVAAKLWTPVITPGAADLTIDYANVPWVFRLMPSDGAQARLLARAIGERGLGRVVLLTAGTRDGRLAVQRVREAARDAGLAVALEVEYDRYAPLAAVPRVAAAAPAALILWGEPDAAALLLGELREAGVDCPVFVPASLVGPALAACGEAAGTVLGAAPFDLEAGSPRLERFRAAVRAASGGEPTHIAAYGYDAAWLLIEGIGAVGLNRARLCDWLAATDTQGVTGRIAFDSLGGSRKEPVLVCLRAGRWVLP